MTKTIFSQWSRASLFSSRSITIMSSATWFFACLAITRRKEESDYPTTGSKIFAETKTFARCQGKQQNVVFTPTRERDSFHDLLFSFLKENWTFSELAVPSKKSLHLDRVVDSFVVMSISLISFGLFREGNSKAQYLWRVLKQVQLCSFCLRIRICCWKKTKTVWTKTVWAFHNLVEISFCTIFDRSKSQKFYCNPFDCGMNPFFVTVKEIYERSTWSQRM